MSRTIFVERDIKLADFYDVTFESQTLPEVVEEIGWLSLIHRTGYASKNLVREFYCAILRARDIEEPSMELTVRNVSIVFSSDELARFLGYERDLVAFPNLPMSTKGGLLRPRKHTAELSYSRVEFLYLVVVRGLLVDMTSYIYQSIRAEALKTNAMNSLLREILLTQFLHAMLVPEGADELRAVPLRSINKTTLSKSIAQTGRALNAARAAKVRRQEQPEEAMEEQDPGQSSTQGFGAQRLGWLDDMMTQLTERMQLVLRPTHEMVSDISGWLTTLEHKVVDMDSGLKKEVATVQEAMKRVATSALLFALNQWVVLIEEHFRQIHDVLKITDDDDDEQ
ncbi:hypothetical protein CJ030_MR0G007797 [Morella rubra]|uniref:Uncharacterized protein n=1 Tax=Morella rubra TaxID=262757 RepID=A0A6A1UJB0_9ROSI|nr:hypothetical protein CJ030_MR0G007797 [Morella rubra]